MHRTKLFSRLPFLIAVFWFVLMMVACGATAVTLSPTPTPTLSPQAYAGKQVFARECGSCHSIISDTIIVGPSLAGIASRAGKRVSGQDGHSYLYTAVLQPNDFIVEGFEGLMPENFGKKLSGEEIDATIAFMQTLE